jgi:hypothetical protein
MFIALLEKESKLVHVAVNNSCMLLIMLRIYCKYGRNPDLGLPFLSPKIYKQENGKYFTGSPAKHSAHLALQNMKFLRFWNCEGYLGFPDSDSDQLTHLDPDPIWIRIRIHHTGLILPIIGRDLPDILLV